MNDLVTHIGYYLILLDVSRLGRLEASYRKRQTNWSEFSTLKARSNIYCSNFLTIHTLVYEIISS